MLILLEVDVEVVFLLQEISKTASFLPLFLDYVCKDKTIK